ncbi:MAG: phosphatase PAP2 family protein [Proteobacteria bacterium]|nr:phosphatase PAP2 family protein [Pseudomonadota bacterium]
MNTRTQNHRLQIINTIHAWDVFTFRRIVSRPRDCILNRCARLVSRTGDGTIYPVIPLLLALAGFDESVEFFRFALVSFCIERLVYLYTKNHFKRKRPANIIEDYDSIIIASDEFSFPSGHSSAAFMMVTLLVLFYGGVFLLFYIWAAAVAVSRVLLGVHFPSDTFVGSLMGIFLALISQMPLLPT